MTTNGGEMGCQKCEHRGIIFSKEFLDDISIILNSTLNKENADYDEYIIFIDRGFLRFAAKDDCECMDHGERVKINFCPFCGEKLG